MEETGSRKRSRVVDPTDICFSSPEVKRIKEDLLENFDEDEFVLASDELESFMKSFQEEILTSTAPVVDLTSESGGDQSQPELGFLREASDNELGLPPFTGVEENIGNKLVRVESAADWAGLNDSELWRFDSEIPSFDHLEFEEIENKDYYKDEYVVLDGLFDYSDMGFGFSDLSWRPEILPAK